MAEHGMDCGPDLDELQHRDVNAMTDEQQPQTDLVQELRELNRRLMLAALREQELRERAQAASDAKSAFLATMSHELRTPLNAIIGYQELLAEGITGPVTPAQKTHLGRIKRSASHLLALIDELLTLSRFEAKREAFQIEEIDIGVVMDEAMTIVAPLAASKGLSIASRREDGPLTIQSNPLRLRQILVNLLGNAVKFTDHGAVALSEREETGRAIFEVRDTGIGIKRTQLARVFEPFWQADQTPTRKSQGSGLGLSVSRHLARMLGGDLTVESTEGEGSTFTLCLPVRGELKEAR